MTGKRKYAEKTYKTYRKTCPMVWLCANSQATRKATNEEIKNCDTSWVLPKEGIKNDFLSVPLRLNTYLHWTIWSIHRVFNVSRFDCIPTSWAWELVLSLADIALHYTGWKEMIIFLAWKLKWNEHKIFRWNLVHMVQRSSAIKPTSLCNHSIYPYYHHQIKLQSMMVDEIGEVESTPGFGI